MNSRTTFFHLFLFNFLYVLHDMVKGEEHEDTPRFILIKEENNN